MILSAHERMVTRRYMAPKGGERIIVLVAGISLAAVTIGVAALIVITSVMNGYHRQMFSKVIAATSHAVVRGNAGGLPEWREVVAKAEATPGIADAEPLVEQRLMVSSEGRVSAARLRGLPRDRIAGDAMRETLMAGSLEARPGTVLIGSELARQLGVFTGATIDLVRIEGLEGEIEVRPVAFEVAGIVETGVFEIDSETVIVQLAEAQQLLGIGNQVTSVELRTADADTVDLAVAPIRAALPKGATLRTWKELNASLSDALAIEAVGMFVLVSMITLIAAFNILSSLVMLVRAKTRDIAIMRTMGASQRSVLRIFVALGTAIGALGTFTGVALGLILLQFRGAIGRGIGALSGQDPTSPGAALIVELPAEVHGWEVAGIAVMALVLSFLATLYPAFRAARTDPVTVLRYE